MIEKETGRLSRLVAILTSLQTVKIITATTLAEKFAVSIRTIYRDIRTLEQAGVPIVTEEGKGYSIMEGYRIPPVMFTESQANALILVEQLVLKNKDTSLVKDYSEAVEKIKAVLRQSEKDKANLLSQRTNFGDIANFERNSNNLSIIQNSLTNFNLIKIEYTNAENNSSKRIIEPFALINTLQSWLLIAYCRLRKEFRFFRLDRIHKLEVLAEKFEPHKMTLQEFMLKYGNS